MNQSEVEAFVEQLENVESEDNFGYLFYFVGDDHKVGFVTIGYSDNEYDTVSNLDREGIFRVNIGISRESYATMFADTNTEGIDYSALNVFMPHPHYAKQHYICILNPSGENEDLTKKLIVEAHSIAAKRYNRKTGS